MKPDAVIEAVVYCHGSLQAKHETLYSEGGKERNSTGVVGLQTVCAVIRKDKSNPVLVDGALVDRGKDVIVDKV
jgi:hypothetical protein